MDSNIQAMTEQAVGKAFDAWAKQHPALAAVISQMAVRDRVVPKLRESTEYTSAVEAYIQGRIEIDFLNKVIDLAAPLIEKLIAGTL